MSGLLAHVCRPCLPDMCYRQVIKATLTVMLRGGQPGKLFSQNKVRDGTPRGNLAASPQVGLNQKPRIVSEPSAVDLHVLNDPLYVVPRLGDGNALDPVDRIDFRIARIAVLLATIPRPARTGVISDKCQHVRSAPAGDVV